MRPFPPPRRSPARALAAPGRLVVEQKRFRGKINIQRPRKLHYPRALVEELVTPFYPETKPPVPIWEACKKLEKDVIRQEPHPYQRIIARECLQRFENARMIGFLHKNSICQEDEFDFQVELHHENMSLKSYGLPTARLALKGTKYEALLSLFVSKYMMVFSPEIKTEALRKIVKKTPQYILLAGVIDDRFLHLNDFLNYGKMSLTDARSQLVHTLRTAGGANLNRQLTHHQTTLVSRLQQIGKSEDKPEVESAQPDVEEPKAE